jgi:hypothetical protein
LYRCPECGSELKTLVYGLIDGPVGRDEIAAGCSLEPNSPSKACSQCDWRGGNGGRTWGTQLSEIWEELDEDSPNRTKTTTHIFDLEKMTDDELIECGESRLEPRYELVFRGYSPENVDEIFDHEMALSLPLIQKQELFIFYNSKTQLIELAAHFQAQTTDHAYLYLMPGMADWSGVYTVKQFHEVQFAMKKDDMQVWTVDLKIQEFEDEPSEPDTYGFPLLKKMIAEHKVSIQDLEKTAWQFKRNIYWPHWFDPGIMLS